MKFLFRKRHKKPTKKSQEHYGLNKELARRVIAERVEYYAQMHNFVYNRVSIKNTTTRWGSCSSLRNLNFNYKLAFLDQQLLDYVVVHELCHLRYMNHSKQFWAEVEKILPEYKQLIQRFKTIRIQDQC